jgi:hypothetical protein
MRATATTGAAITGHQSDDTASLNIGALRRGRPKHDYSAREPSRLLSRFAWRFTAQTCRTDDIDVVDNLFDVLNVSHQFLKDLLEIKAGDAAAKDQPTFREAPTDVLENGSIGAFIDPTANRFVNRAVGGPWFDVRVCFPVCRHCVSFTDRVVLSVGLRAMEGCSGRPILAVA